ncbi:efflux RND transporter periplasmic adaptor subunit [Candidatus Albibeggiatoa sp. nov. BB20]|uniref:efflux RND transporter periplasmic adaptor subunit n=1 Tax=Candidatus Albibeggiatoa sp. nov. BB20 TaxID=3162723 RepID=UPI0033655CF2
MQLKPHSILLILFIFSPTVAAEDKKAISVIVAPVIQENIIDTISILGTSQANESIDVTSKITDIINKIHFKEGQWVKKGQLLVQLDDAEQQALLQETEVNLAEQQREYNRLSKLVKQKAISSSQLDAQLSRLKAAKARIKTAKVHITERKIIAPFSGKLGLRYISMGALLQAGDVITTLDDIQKIKLDFTIPAIYLASLHKGLKLTATTQAYPKRLFSGQVTTIDSRVDPVSRMLKLRAIMPNKDEALRAGMLLTVKLNLNPRQALMVSERALVPIGSQQFVYVITDALIAEKRLIEIGQRQVGKVEVTHGLALDENVVVEGTLRLKPNTAVKLITASP